MASSSSSPPVPCRNPRFAFMRCRAVDRDTALYSQQTVTGRSGAKPVGHAKYADHSAVIECACNRCCECDRHQTARRYRTAMEEAKRARDCDDTTMPPTAKRAKLSASSAAAAAAAASASASSPSSSLHQLPVITDVDVVQTKSDLRDRFDIDSKTGSGTFSSVYRARVRDHPLNSDLQLRLSRLSPRRRPQPDEREFVALKRFLTHSHAKRLETEEEYLFRFGDMEHHILPLLGTHHQLGAPPTLILPYCPHQEFRDNFTRMSLRMIQTYLRGLLTALQHLHRFRIIHRDVKPDNFLFDFDLARSLESPPSPSAAAAAAAESPPRIGFLVDFGLAHTELQLKSELLRDHRMPAHVGDDLIEAQQHKADAADGHSDEEDEREREREAVETPTPSTPHLSVQSPTPYGDELPAGLPRARAVPTMATPRKSPRKSAPSLRLRESLQSHAIRDRLPPRPIHPRAGTRGYRAPETLAYSQQQGVGVDIWSVGATLLSILTHKYPFFSCPEDETGLAEIMHVLHAERGRAVEIRIAGQKITYEWNYTPTFDLEKYCRSGQERQQAGQQGRHGAPRNALQ